MKEMGLIYYLNSIFFLFFHTYSVVHDCYLQAVAIKPEDSAKLYIVAGRDLHVVSLSWLLLSSTIRALYL